MTVLSRGPAQLSFPFTTVGECATLRRRNGRTISQWARKIAAIGAVDTQQTYWVSVALRLSRQKANSWKAVWPHGSELLVVCFEN